MAATGESEDAAQLQFGDEFDEARVVWNAEVKLLLEKYMDRQKHLGGTDETVNPLLKQTLEYARKLDYFPDLPSIERARHLESAYPNLAPFELAQLVNLAPDSSEEAFSLIPTLKEKYDHQRMNQLIDDVKKHQK